jgi:hypothetical protein
MRGSDLEESISHNIGPCHLKAGKRENIAHRFEINRVPVPMSIEEFIASAASRRPCNVVLPFFP